MRLAVSVREATKTYGTPSLPAVKWLPRRLQHPVHPGPEALAPALERVSLVVAEQEIFRVIGPVGAGKSTLIRLLGGLLPPDEGEISIFGYDAVLQQRQAQRLVNRVSVEASFFKQLSPVENLLYSARLDGLGRNQAHRQIVEDLTSLGLEPVLIHQPLETLTRSQQRLVTIAQAILARPALLLLDEPTLDLDPGARARVIRMLRELRQLSGTTIVVTARSLDEVVNLCDQAAVLDQGRIQAVDTPGGLCRRSVRPEPNFSLAAEFLRLACQEQAPFYEP